MPAGSWTAVALVLLAPAAAQAREWHVAADGTGDGSAGAPFGTLDGQYGDDDAVRVETAGSFLVLRGVEVRRAQRDCIDMGGPEGVLIEGGLVHHCLNAARGRTDAHGVVGGPVRDLTIRDTEIHTFSGEPENGFPAGACDPRDRRRRPPVAGMR